MGVPWPSLWWCASPLAQTSFYFLVMHKLVPGGFTPTCLSITTKGNQVGGLALCGEGDGCVVQWWVALRPLGTAAYAAGCDHLPASGFSRTGMVHPPPYS